MSDESGRALGDERAAPAPRARDRARSRVRGVARAGACAGLGALTLVCLAVGAFFLLLWEGPISLTWLAPRIVAALDERFAPGLDFKLAGVVIANSDNGPTLTLDGLLVRANGRAILAAPRAELSLDWPSVFLGRLQPRRLEALDLDLRLSVQADGVVALTAGADPLATGAAAPPADPSAPPDSDIARVALLKTIGAALRGLMDFVTSPDSPVGALDKIGLQHARLTIDDRTIDRTIRYRDVALSLTKSDGGMRFSLAATGPSRRWTVAAAAHGAPGGNRAFIAKVKNLSMDEIAVVGGLRAPPFDTDAPIGLDMSFSLGPKNDVLDAKGGVEIGKGFFRLEDPDHEPVMIERIAARAGWSPAARKLTIAPFEFHAGGFNMALAGEAAAPAELPAGADPGADAWTIALRLVAPTLVAPERGAEKTLSIVEGGAQARVLHGQGRVLVDRIALSGPEIRVAASGSGNYRGETRVTYALDVEDTQIHALARLWPTHVTPPIRAWFVDHVPTGTIKHARCVGNFDAAALRAMRFGTPPADEALEVTGEIVNGSVIDVLDGMAPLTGVNGRMRVTGRTAAFDATSAALETAPGRRLAVAEGRFSIADNALRPTPAVLDLKVGGTVEAVTDLLAVPSVAAHASLPVDPASMKGQVDGRLRIDFDIGEGARDERTSFAVDAVASNLVVDKLIGKEKLEAGNLRVIADRSGLRVAGGGRIYGAPAALELKRGFGDKGPAQAQVTLTFDEAARQRAGYAVPGVSGPVSAVVRTPLPAEDLAARIELDLTRTAFDNPIPGVVKAAGRPGRASFTVVKRGDGVALDQFVFDASPAQAQGVIELTRDWGLRAARLTAVRLSPGDDMRFEVTRAADALKVVARGANFDARPMLAAMIRSGGVAGGGGGERAAGAGKAAGDDMDVDFKAPIVTGHGKQILSNVELKYEARGGRPRALGLTGNFGRDQLALAMTRGAAGQQLDVSTNDAGSFLAFLDLYRKMENGALNASLTLGSGTAEGKLQIRDFLVKGEPTMRQLMAQSGVARADDRGNMRFDPDTMRVGRLQTGFTWNGGKLSVREGVMSGPEIGLTFDGFIDFPRDRLDLSGSYVPAYALNSLLSNIPVLNVVLTGGQHEGVFALNYRVTGAMNAPVVNVNPLSAIAPGLMRKIMGVLDGTARAPEGR